MLIGDVWISPPMVPELSERTGVHRTTVQRWLKTKKIPEAMYQLLDLLLNGSLARIHGAWHGWHIDAGSGELITATGWRITAGEILAIQLRYQQLAALKVQNAELREQLRRLATPGNVEEDHAVKNNRCDAGDRQKSAGGAA